MALLERRPQLERIRQRFDALTAEGSGTCVVVAGEAGIGKTSLLRAFVHDLPAATRTRTLWAGCEALFTPRPLGPLIDLAAHFPPSIEHALHQGGTYNSVFPGLLRHFGDSASPRVLVIEDMQWADAGTMDFVRYLGRRIHTLPLLLLLSHRDEGIDAEHPLLRVLGDLPAATTLRQRLEPLSLAAVGALAECAQRPADAVWRASRGNPFYVTELLAAPEAEVPPSVRDAVLASLGGLSPAARALASTVSLFPKAAPLARLEAMGAMGAMGDDANAGAVDECLRAGVVMLIAEADGDALAFRHEIARNVVHDAMPAGARRRGHADAFAAWQASADAETTRTRCITPKRPAWAPKPRRWHPPPLLARRPPATIARPRAFTRWR